MRLCFLLQKHFAGELEFYECESRMRHKAGHWVWVMDRGKLATREADGLSFRIELESPIPHSTPLQMTTDLTRSLEVRVTADPGQWFWIHKRWK